MFLNDCKQTFYISHVRISQKVKGVLMWNLQHIISYEDKYIGWFSNPHKCTFNYFTEKSMKIGRKWICFFELLLKFNSGFSLN